jgi:hypothetical protein
MAFSARFLTAATLALSLSLAVAPALQAREGHGGDRRGGEWHGGRGHHGGNAGVAIVGGLFGLGLGAAIASGGGVPPPAYYAPPPGYYTPPPPAVYYGY